MSSKSLHLGRKEMFMLLVISLLFLIPITQQQTTETEYSTITETEAQTVIKTMTTTIPSTRTEESEYETYTIVATTTFVPFRTYRLVEWETMDAAGGIEAGVSKIYYITLRLMFITTEIKTTTTDTVTLTESVESTYLTESLTTKTKLRTIELLRTYETEEPEEPEKEETQFVAIPMNYLIIGGIIAAIAVIAIATLKRRPHVAGARYCTNCGATIPRGSKFCLKCGAEQE